MRTRHGGKTILNDAMRHAVLAIPVCAALSTWACPVGWGIEWESTAAQAPSHKIALVAGEGLREPFAIDFDTHGNLYVAEMGGQGVSVIDTSGKVTKLAGTGEAGLSGDGGPAASARLNNPHHLLLAPEGRQTDRPQDRQRGQLLYVADTLNFSVRTIDLRTRVITRLAGTGQKGFTGDGGPAIDAQFGGIYALALRGRLLYVCDLDNRRVRTINLDTGIVNTVAGNGMKGAPQDGEAALSQPLVDPRAIAVDAKGYLYICERNGHALRVVDPSGRIRTIAGTGEPGFSGDDGPARTAKLNGPKSIAMDGEDVLIADTENHVIRRYSPKDGTISRVAGTGTQGTEGLGGPATSCQLNRPHGAHRNPTTGILYIADSENHRVLSVDPR
jgi:DNA-binding beta-propeller fold protein YncE